MKNFEQYLNESNNIQFKEDISKIINPLIDDFILGIKTHIEYICDVLLIDMKVVGDQIKFSPIKNMNMYAGVKSSSLALFYDNDDTIEDLEQLESELVWSVCFRENVMIKDSIMISIIEKEPGWIKKHFIEEAGYLNLISPEIKEKYAHIFKNELF